MSNLPAQDYSNQRLFIDHAKQLILLARDFFKILDTYNEAQEYDPRCGLESTVVL